MCHIPPVSLELLSPPDEEKGVVLMKGMNVFLCLVKVCVCVPMQRCGCTFTLLEGRGVSLVESCEIPHPWFRFWKQILMMRSPPVTAQERI